jgi:hypothetical protein
MTAQTGVPKRSPVSRAPCYCSCMRKSQPTRKSPTHFEQIPVEAVRKIAPPPEETPEKRRTGTNAVAPKPTLKRAEPSKDSGHFHGVQFYNDPDALCRIVGGFMGEGVEQGNLAVMIVTPDHGARIESCLRSRGIDVDTMKRLGHLVALDARELLQRFMIDGMPNPGMFRRAVGALLTDVRRGREHCSIRAYGEMVDLLWKDGREAAAIRLETLWNQLGSTHDFELLCGYSMGNFYKGAAIDEIKGQHSHVVTDDGSPHDLTAAHA